MPRLFFGSGELFETEDRDESEIFVKKPNFSGGWATSKKKKISSHLSINILSSNLRLKWVSWGLPKLDEKQFGQNHSIFIGVMASVKWETFGESPFETEVSSLKIPEPLKVGCLRRFSFARKVACLANPKLKGSATRLFELLLMMLYFLINYLFLFIIC